jgi:hypothetical protein
MARKISMFFVLILIIVNSAFCQQKEVPLDPAEDFDYYPYIGYLTQGKPVWDMDAGAGEADGYVYRVAIIYSEIYSVVMIETISIRGIEGSERKVDSARFLNSYRMAEAFDLENKGEFLNFEFLRWVSPISFEFRAYDMDFVASDIDKEKIKVEKIE